MIPNREAELTRKLAETFHLSVPERASLPGGKVRWSVLVRAVGEILAESGWFAEYDAERRELDRRLDAERDAMLGRLDEIEYEIDELVRASQRGKQ